MASEPGDGDGNNPRRVPAAPGPIRIGGVTRQREANPATSGFPPGVGMNIEAPDLDIKALSFVSCEASIGALDLRDRKNTQFKIRRTPKESSPYTLDHGPRGKVRSVPFSDAMAQELIPGIHDAVQRAVRDPILGKHTAAAAAFVEAMAKVARITLASGAPRSTAGKGNETVTGFKQNQKSFSGEREGIRAPPAISPTANARPELTTDVLSAALPGIHVTSLRLTEAQVKQGFVELLDSMDGRVSVQQTKYTPPPQFTVEFQITGDSAQRIPLTAAMARELSGLIQVVAPESPFIDEPVVAKGLLVYAQALLKVP